MISAEQLDALDPQTRQAMLTLLAELRAKDELIAQRDREAAFKQALIEKLTHENALLKRLKFAATSERFAASLAPEQKSLLEETLDSDLAELDREIERERGDTGDKDKTEKKTPKRTPLPPHLPRRDVLHEPADTNCGCGQAMQRIGEDVAEKLDYQPGVFTVERHVRGKWACRCCQKLMQAPVPAHVIDKGIPTAGLLAQVLVAKFLDHLPLYRQEAIFERAGHLIARSTLAQWVGECGAQLQPLVNALADELRRHVVLHADEMRLPPTFGVHSSSPDNAGTEQKEMNESRHRGKYTLEFKREAVRQVKAGRATAVVARTLGVPKASLSNWVRAEGKGQLGLTAEGKPAPEVTAEQAEIARLRAEVARLKMERDIAKKAAAYFAQDVLQGTPRSGR